MTAPFALVTFASPGGLRKAGILVDERISALSDVLIASRLGLGQSWETASVMDLLHDWDNSFPLLCRVVDEIRGGLSISRLDPAGLAIHPPVDRPTQVFCTGANYRKHVVQLTVDMKVGPEGLQGDDLRRWAEKMMDERARTGEPYVFTKPVSAIAGAYDDLHLPTSTKMPDWELELGVVIGRGGYQISGETAMNHVAGYAIVNDVSARDLIARTDYKMLGTDWLRSKGQPGFLPFGPSLVPASFVANPQDLRMKLSVNGQVMQDESTADMMFDIARQIEYISRYTRLLPGDLICTGSPAGNGTHYGRYLQPGDLMVAQIEGLGEQRVRCLEGAPHE